MAREGIDSFLLDCQCDDKLKLIEAEFGLKGFAVVVKLWQKIYFESGYYCEWNEDVGLLFSDQIKESYNLVSEIVGASVRRGIFSKELYEEYGILSSRGIQKRYLKVVERRTKVEVKKEYLLLDVGNLKENVCIIEKNVCRNDKNVCKNSTSKVKESKVKVSIKHNVHSQKDADALFEELWKLYKNKKGKGSVSNAKKREILAVGKDQMIRCIERYEVELQKDIKGGFNRRRKNGSTFFNSGYKDYLDSEYVPSKEGDYEPRSGTDDSGGGGGSGEYDQTANSILAELWGDEPGEEGAEVDGPFQ